uniref:Regulatory protein E2 n=1 Tax=Bos taurus papillomavirus 2 TaxID=2758382 RepID=S5PSJ9_BPV2|nr:E2 protein [Bos taurus papillomavirus 2]
METACERLHVAQETQMQLIEKSSDKLQDHILYWTAVRTENTLLYAARKKGVTVLGHCRVPHSVVCQERAKQAIEMQLSLQELSKTEFGNEPWSLLDTSWDRYMSEPKRCFKKGARVVEVEFDGNASNTNWYTVYSKLYMRTEDGWQLAKAGADGTGLYYCTMAGAGRIYYSRFGEEAARFSTTGHYSVRDQDRVYAGVSSTSSDFRDRPDGVWVASEGPEGDPAGKEAEPAQPVSSLLGSPACGPIRAGLGWVRDGPRPHPYYFPAGSGGSLLRSASTPVQGSVPVDLAPRQEEEENQSPDSTEEEPVTVPRHTSDADGFHLLKAGQSCFALISGSANQVKCYRFRVKKNHRHRYESCTTTWFTVADNGAERQGQAQILITFGSPGQRQDFLKHVPLPPGMNISGFTASLDF